MPPIIPRETLEEIDDLRKHIVKGEEVDPATLNAALRKYRAFREIKASANMEAKEAKAVKKAGVELPSDLLTTLNI